MTARRTRPAAATQAAGPAASAAGCAAEAARWDSTLRALGTPERAAAQKAYLKSDLDFAGVPMPAIRTFVASWQRARPGLSRDDLTGLVRALWSSPLYESRQGAVVLLERCARLLRPGDVSLLAELITDSRTWALTDGLAVIVTGDLAARYPGEVTAALDRWAAAEDFWLRRSAMLALMKPMRAGVIDFERFAGYADAMLAEKEFFVRKAIGWVLRETAKRRPDLVAAWLGPRVHRASGVTVREAVKPLPAELRTRLLAGYQDKRPVRWDHDLTRR